MAVNIQITRFQQNDETHLNQAWDIKENIRYEQELLYQKWTFFQRIYRNGDVYLYQDTDNELHGFAILNEDDYLSVLAVAPEHQGQGIGTALIEAMKQDYNSVSCHTRVSNQKALDFYKSHGFRIKTIESSYYDNGDDAYILQVTE